MRRRKIAVQMRWLARSIKGFRPKHAARHLLEGAREGWYVKGDEQSSNRFAHLRYNYSANTVANLIGGNFLTGLLLLMGATDSFIGLISMITFAANLLQLFAPLLLERFPQRKKLLIGLKALLHLFNIVFIGLIPFLPIAQQGKLAMVFMGVLVVNVISAIISPGMSIWHIQFLPPNMRRRYFPMLSMTNGILVAVVTLAASGLVDIFKDNNVEIWGLTLLRVAAVGVAVLDLWFLSRMKEYPYEQDSARPTLFQLLIEPFRQSVYLRTVAIAFLWSMVANIPGAYYTVYLLRDVGVGYSFITLVSLINVPVLIFLTPVWSRILRNTSWLRTLNIALFAYLLHYFLLAGVTKATLWLYPIAMLLAYTLTTGINLAFTGIPYVNIPKKNQTIYIGFYSTISNLGALLGATIGRAFVSRTDGIVFELLGTEWTNKQVLVALVGVVMLGAAIAIFFLRRNVVEDE